MNRLIRRVVLSVMVAGLLVPAGNVLAAGKMYWTDVALNTIQRANLDGTGVEVLVFLVEVESDPFGIALDVAGGKMYWTDSSTDKIRRANLDGTGVEDLVTTGATDFHAIALDVAAGKMYWSDITTDKIQRANLNGTGIEDLVTITGFSGIFGIALDVAGGKMYWTDGGSDDIKRANLDGTGVEVLVTGLFNPLGIALDVAGGKMYWLNNGDNKIQRANLNGTGVEVLVTLALSSTFGIALDVAGGKMYWTDATSQKIQRANLNGTGVEDLVTLGLTSDPTAIALDLPGLFDNLVGYWPADVNGDDPTVDATVNGNDMDLGATNTFPETDDPAYDCTLANIAPTPGNVCGLEFTSVFSVFSAGDFTSDSDFATVPHANVLDVKSAYTISAWVRIEDLLVPSTGDCAGCFTYRPILVRGADDDVTSANEIEVYVQANSKDLIVAHNRDTGGTFDFVGFVDPPLDTIFHLVVRYDGTNVNVFYDGVSQAVAQQTTAMAANPDTTDKDWLIGKVNHGAFVNFPTGSGREKFFEGLIDEVMIFGTDLTDAQIATLFAGSYFFDGCSDALAAGGGDIESLEVTSVGGAHDRLTVVMELCAAKIVRAKYRVHFDYTGDLASTIVRLPDGCPSSTNPTGTTSDDTTILHKRARGERVTGPGDVDNGGSTITYMIPYGDLGLDDDADVEIWGDAHVKGSRISDRAPDTDGSDGCSKPTGGNEVIQHTLD